MVEPLWPSVLNYIRQMYKMKSVVEAGGVEQTEEEMHASIYQVFGSLLPEDQAKDFLQSIKEYEGE